MCEKYFLLDATFFADEIPLPAGGVPCTGDCEYTLATKILAGFGPPGHTGCRQPSQMPNGRTLQRFRDGRRQKDTHSIQLPTGAEANLYTLSEMAKIVREDAALPDLRAFAERYIIRGGGVDAAFSFCRDEIHYRPEGPDTETIADMWSCMFGIDPTQAVGDCAIKSTVLATLLSYLKLKPIFRALQQIPGADFYNHVFVGYHDAAGKFVALDPTPPEFRPGDMLPSLSYLDYRIFS